MKSEKEIYKKDFEIMNGKGGAMMREYFFRLFLFDMREYIYSLNLPFSNQKIINCFVSLLYSQKCKIDFNNLDIFKGELDYYFSSALPSSPQCDEGNDENNGECNGEDNDEEYKKYKEKNELITFMKENYEKIDENVQKYKCKVLLKKFRVPYKYKFYEPLFFEKSEHEKLQNKMIVLTHLKYDNLEFIGPGNQWTMRYAAEMKMLNKLGFIEVFASPYNRTLDRYCSLFETDKFFGAMCSFENLKDHLLDGIVKLCISPPSGYNIQKKIVDFCLDILKTRKAIISLGLSKPASSSFSPLGKNEEKSRKDEEENLFIILKKSGFMKDYKFNDFCYDYKDNIDIKMTHRPWLAIILSTEKINARDYLYFKTESKYENPKAMMNLKQLFEKEN